MKKVFAICAVVALVLCSCKTGGEKQPASITKSEVKEASYMLGYNFGQVIKYNNFGELELCQIEKGIKDALKDVEVSPDSLNTVLNAFIEKRMTAVAEANKEAGAKFLEKNGTEDGVVTTESGLQYKIVRDGNGVKPTSLNDVVEVNYEGTTLDGEVFDSSYEREEPATFALNQVIKGWGEGLQNIDEGGEIILWIPADLAYGDRGAGEKIKPGSTLKFKVELIKVTPAEKEAETK